MEGLDHIMLTSRYLFYHFLQSNVCNINKDNNNNKLI